MGKVKKGFYLIKKCIRHPKFLFRGCRTLVIYGLHGVKVNFQTEMAYYRKEYIEPVEVVMPDEEQNNIEGVLEIEKELRGPKFSIVMPVYNVEPKWLQLAIESIQNQTHENWELCIADDCSTREDTRQYLSQITDERIKICMMPENGGISRASNAAAAMAEGEYIVLMDNDDIIAPNALEEFANVANDTYPDIIYSDQDIVDMEGNHRDPLHKPDWSLDLFRSQMYIGHLLGFKKSLFELVGGFRTEFNGSQDYDLVLRMIEHTYHVVHIPKVLYSWRDIPSSTAANPESKPYAQTAGLKAIQEHLDRTYGKNKATVSETENLFVYDVRYHLETTPKVSIIIPTRDHIDLLNTAVNSILEKTSYSNYEIVIVNNNSEEQNSYEYFGRLATTYDNIKVVNAFCEFNWSKLNNIGIENATGECYVFLNNDIEIISPEWLERLVEKAMREDVGVVGGLLLYEDNTIQHAGIVAGMKDWGDHVFKGYQPVHYGSPFVSPMVTRNVTAVTGACMAVSKDTIKQIGTFSEEYLICGSDVELCVRAFNNNLWNIYDPFVRLYHYESKSRDSFIPEIDFRNSYDMYTPYREKGDPFYSIALDYFSEQPKLENGEHQKHVDSYRVPSIVPIKPVRYADSAMEGRPEEEGLPVPETEICEIAPYTLRKVEYPRKRINLLVPSVNPEHVFGGIATALKFYNELASNLGYDKRIILVDSYPHDDVVAQYADEYELVQSTEDSDAPNQMVPYNDRYMKSLAVSENDYFVFTAWWTANCMQAAYVESGMVPNKFIYLIQDYEPGFYPWSSRYLLADSTYRNEYPMIAVFNSGLLKEFFDNHNYKFYRSFVFEPVLNAGLKESLLSRPSMLKKKKRILIYGRPGTDRNAFSLVISALKKWVWLQEDIAEWEILSAGEMHRTVDLGNEKVVKSVGKLTIEEYADMLAESYAGISLMASPHPSYPPLEMAVFGVKVITNTYENKDLSNFNSNITSLADISVTNIAKHLNMICDGYEEMVENRIQNKEYIENENIFAFTKEIKEILENSENM